MKSFEDHLRGLLHRPEDRDGQGHRASGHERPDVEAFKKIVHDSGVDLCVISKLVDISDETVYHTPAPTLVRPGHRLLRHWATTTSRRNAMVNDPGHISTLEGLQGRGRTSTTWRPRRLVWSGLPKTTDPRGTSRTA